MLLYVLSSLHPMTWYQIPHMFILIETFIHVLYWGFTWGCLLGGPLENSEGSTLLKLYKHVFFAHPYLGYTREHVCYYISTDNVHFSVKYARLNIMVPVSLLFVIILRSWSCDQSLLFDWLLCLFMLCNGIYLTSLAITIWGHGVSPCLKHAYYTCTFESIITM